MKLEDQRKREKLLLLKEFKFTFPKSFFFFEFTLKIGMLSFDFIEYLFLGFKDTFEGVGALKLLKMSFKSLNMLEKLVCH